MSKSKTSYEPSLKIMISNIDTMLQNVTFEGSYPEKLYPLTQHIIFNYILNGRAMDVIDLCSNRLIAYFRNQLPDPVNGVVFEGDSVHELANTPLSVYFVESLAIEIAGKVGFMNHQAIGSLLHTYLNTSKHQSYLHNTLMKMSEYMKYVPPDFCSTCAGLGYFDLLVFAHKYGAIWDMRTTQKAFNNKHFECFIYAYNKHCPLPDAFYDDVLKIAVFNDEPRYLSTILEDIDMGDDFITIDEGFITAIIEHNALKVGEYMLKRDDINPEYTTVHEKMLTSGSYNKIRDLFAKYNVYKPAVKFKAQRPINETYHLPQSEEKIDDYGPNSVPLTRKGGSHRFLGF